MCVVQKKKPTKNSQRRTTDGSAPQHQQRTWSCDVIFRTLTGKKYQICTCMEFVKHSNENNKLQLWRRIANLRKTRLSQSKHTVTQHGWSFRPDICLILHKNVFNLASCTIGRTEAFTCMSVHQKFPQSLFVVCIRHKCVCNCGVAKYTIFFLILQNCLK